MLSFVLSLFFHRNLQFSKLFPGVLWTCSGEEDFQALFTVGVSGHLMLSLKDQRSRRAVMGQERRRAVRL